MNELPSERDDEALQLFLREDFPAQLSKYLGAASEMGVPEREIVFLQSKMTLPGQRELREQKRASARLVGRTYDRGGANALHAKNYHSSWFVDDDGWFCSFSAYENRPREDGTWVRDAVGNSREFVLRFGPWTEFKHNEAQYTPSPFSLEDFGSIEQLRKALVDHFDHYVIKMLVVEGTSE